MAGCFGYKDVLPFTAMIVAECSNVVLNILFKAATLKGMSYFVFIVYSSAIATLVLLPFAVLCRTSSLPPFSFPLFGRIGVIGIIRSLADIIIYSGINYGSPTLASALSNLIPALTFILAVILRMERLALRRTGSRAKVLGAIVAISGAFVVTFWKGPPIIRTPSTSNSLQWSLGSQSNWIIGGVFLSAGYILYSICYIVQAKICKEYPAEIILVFLYNLCTTVITALVFLIAETDFNVWRVRPDISLAAIAYSGLFGCIFYLIVYTWCLRLKGPVYVALFKPVSIAIAAVMSVVFLGDTVHLGTFVGAIILSLGFYAVMWGKAKEETGENLGPSILEPSSTENMPLLQGDKSENM